MRDDLDTLGYDSRVQLVSSGFLVTERYVVRS